MFKAKRLDHLALSVSDVAEAARTWQRTLGLRLDALIEPQGSHLRLGRLPVGDAFLELVQPLAGAAAPGEGMLSISIEVDDLAAAVADLRRRGLVVSDPQEGFWPGTRLARISPESAHGVPIELVSHAAEPEVAHNPEEQ
jgi:catechol 2,3-dioxygenase-like lactoylglutathione lyase family enzyme